MDKLYSAASQAHTQPLPSAQVKDARDQSLRDTAQKFEASFLSEMMKFANVVKARDGIMGGGAGEKTFSSFLTNAYAQEMSQHHSIGLAERIYATLKDRITHD